jgi:hypothetical protein
VGAEAAAKSCAARWKPKSSTACSRAVVVKLDRKGFEVSNTSPNMKNSRLPASRAWARTSGANACQNSVLTCFTVSIRKPSMPKSEIQPL